MTGTVQDISQLAKQLGIDPTHLVPYGSGIAKLRHEAAEGRTPGKLILVTAMTPTGAGEGKTTTSISLGQGLASLGEKVCVALREPSLGPMFGMKGGATGGGKASLVPEEDINMHFTGDFHAITAAHNLLAALLDNHIHFGNQPEVDPRRISWRRVIDMNDRALRHVVIGLGGVLQGVPRETGFDITPASEIMAALCLAENAADLRGRLSRLIVAEEADGSPLTAEHVGAVGAMMRLLKYAMLPNLVQTCEGVPTLVHGGPFANIAHGCNSVIATRMALSMGDWAITEAGFGSDLGAEKFMDIKCGYTGLAPAAVVLVATVRALKRHGGKGPKDLATPDPAAVAAGLPNLFKHIENVRGFDREPVVSINRFDTDSDAEVAVVRKACEAQGVRCAVSTAFKDGGKGAEELARAVMETAEQEDRPLKPTYDWSSPVKDKIKAIATKLYGADGVDYAPPAIKDLARIERLGFSGLPVCMAKTPLSLSDDPKRICRPTGFRITVRNVLLSAGAGFLVPLAGDIIRMPGLPKRPNALDIEG
jgi:formate--tetrahydrofolate ligase